MDEKRETNMVHKIFEREKKRKRGKEEKRMCCGDQLVGCLSRKSKSGVERTVSAMCVGRRSLSEEKDLEGAVESMKGTEDRTMCWTKMEAASEMV